MPIDELGFPPAFLLAGADEPSCLPVELQRVLRLPETPRLCFVLRILEGWPREKCAEVLGIPAQAVDDETGAAARALARFAEKELIP